MNISSFGEDEQGELYVVDLGGTVSRIAPATPCAYAISPAQRNVPVAGGAASVTVDDCSGLRVDCGEQRRLDHVRAARPRGREWNGHLHGRALCREAEDPRRHDHRRGTIICREADEAPAADSAQRAFDALTASPLRLGSRRSRVQRARPRIDAG